MSLTQFCATKSNKEIFWYVKPNNYPIQLSTFKHLKFGFYRTKYTVCSNYKGTDFIKITKNQNKNNQKAKTNKQKPMKPRNWYHSAVQRVIHYLNLGQSNFKYNKVTFLKTKCINMSVSHITVVEEKICTLVVTNQIQTLFHF